MSTKDTIFEITSQQIGVDVEKLTPESTLNELGADSMDMTELAMEIEEEFDIDITDDWWAQVKTLGQIVEEVDRIKSES